MDYRTNRAAYGFTGRKPVNRSVAAVVFGFVLLAILFVVAIAFNIAGIVALVAGIVLLVAGDVSWGPITLVVIGAILVIRMIVLGVRK